MTSVSGFSYDWVVTVGGWDAVHVIRLALDPLCAPKSLSGCNKTLTSDLNHCGR